MHFDFGFYSSLLLVFFVHMIVYAFLLVRKSILQQQPAPGWLGFFLLLAALYISPWMLGFAGWYDTQPYKQFLLYFPMQHLFAIGPVVYFYVQSLLNPGFVFTRKQLVHFIPALLYLLFTAWMAVYDFIIAGDTLFLADGADRDFDTWYQLSGFVSMLYYFSLSLRYYLFYRDLIRQVLSNADTLAFKWVRNFLIAILAILLARLILMAAGLFADLDYISTWWYYLGFSLSIYYIAITGYSNAISSQVSFTPADTDTTRFTLLQYPVARLTLPEPAESNELKIDSTETNKTESDPELEKWKIRLDTAMREEQWYTDPELNLPQMARKLNTNISLLSRCINRGYQLNFNDFVNSYRVAAVIRLLKLGRHRNETLLSLAYECGFNSKTTFNRAFRKQTGQSPQEFLRNLPPLPEEKED